MAYVNGKKVLFSPRIQITGNGAGGDAILSVVSLPTENISTTHFYRTSDGAYWYDGEKWHTVNDGEIDASDILGKISMLNIWSGYSHNLVANDYGVSWRDDFAMRDSEGEDISTGIIDQHIPLVAGKNVKFNADGTSPVVKIDVPLDNINYNNLLDRPFGDGVGEPIHVTITNTLVEDGHRVSFDGGTSDTWEAYQVSKSTYDKEQLLGGEVVGAINFITIDESHIVEDTEDGLTLAFDDDVFRTQYIWIARTTNYQPNGFDVPFPAVGVYFSSAYNDYESFGVQQLEFSHRRKMLDNKFLDLPKNEDFKALKKKVEEGGSGGTNNIVVPAQGFRGNANFVESIPGLVKLYNESAGLGIDAHGQLGIVAATEDEIAKKESRRKPIVPATMLHAMQENSFMGDLAKILSTSADANTPVGAFAVVDFVLKNLLYFKMYKIPRGGMFEIKPGMLALVFPYGDYTLSVHESPTADAMISKMGATAFLAVDWGADSEDPDCYWTAFMYAKSATLMPTVSSHHTKYTQNCYIKNNDTGTSGTGYAYVYYLSRGSEV